MPDAKAWYEFADRLEKTAIRMFEELELPTSERKDTYAVTLLARTISNFNGVMVLINAALVVEARTLMRCCWENAFYLTGIAKRGEEFVREMLTSDLTTRHALGERLFQQKLVERGNEAEDHLRQVLKTLKKAKGQSRTPKDIADSGPMSVGYIIYMTVSDDAAHPTVRSLSRHIKEGPEPGVIDIIARAGPEEVIETIDFACGALLGACYAFGEAMGGSRAAPEVKERLAELGRLKELR